DSREVRPEDTICCRSTYRVTGPATGGQELFLPLGEKWVGGLGRVAQLLRKPGLVVGLAGRDDVKRHQRVLSAAVFGALAAINAWCGGSERIAVDPARDHIELAGQIRNPEAVNDIPRFQDELDGSIYANRHLLGRGKSRVPQLVVEARTPPVLRTGNLGARLRRTNREQCLWSRRGVD